jgi:hypothetical protein
MRENLIANFAEDRTLFFRFNGRGISVELLEGRIGAASTSKGALDVEASG